MSSGTHVRAIPPITVTAQIISIRTVQTAKSKTVSKGSKSTKDEKRASEAAVDAAASASVEQT
jgi:hypothetical protein